MNTSRARTLAVLAITSAIAVAVIYLPQSMLGDQSRNLGVSNGAAGVIGMTVQLGYAVGIFLLVPLADRVHPRVQVTIQSLILAAALLVSSVMPTVSTVAVAFLVVGLVANIAQVLIPAARALSSDNRAGATTSVMVGAIVVGMFGGRILAGTLVDVLGWRWVVALFAGLVLGTVPLSRRVLDISIAARAPSTRYRDLLIGTLRLSRTSPVLVQSTIIQFLVFCTFNAFWSVMVLHLTSEPFGWTALQAAMFGFVGIAAGIVTIVTGGVIDRSGPLPVIGVGLVLLLVATGGIAILDPSNPWLFAGLLFLVTLANQSILSASQSRALAANPTTPAQANTLFMAGVFLGGSAGALTGVVAYELGEMRMVATAAVGLVVAGLGAWLAVVVTAGRRTPTTNHRSLSSPPAHAGQDHCQH